MCSASSVHLIFPCFCNHLSFVFYISQKSWFTIFFLLSYSLTSVSLLLSFHKQLRMLLSWHKWRKPTHQNKTNKNTFHIIASLDAVVSSFIYIFYVYIYRLLYFFCFLVIHSSPRTLLLQNVAYMIIAGKYQTVSLYNFLNLVSHIWHLISLFMNSISCALLSSTLVFSLTIVAAASRVHSFPCI